MPYLIAALILMALRDVGFARIAQSVDVALLGVLCFGPWTVWRLLQGGARRFWAALPAIRWQGVSAGVLTALAWLAYLYSLTVLEPAVAIILFTGMGPVATWLGCRIWPSNQVAEQAFSRGEMLIQGGLLAVLASVLVGVGLGQTASIAPPMFGPALGPMMISTILVGAAALALLSGVLAPLAMIQLRQASEAGLGVADGMALRYLPLVLVMAVLAADGWPAGGALPPWPLLLLIAGGGLLVIVAPAYALQKSLQSVSALTVELALAAVPALLFLFQTLEGRVAWSPFTFGSVIAFSALCLLGIVWRAGRVWIKRLLTGRPGTKQPAA